MPSIRRSDTVLLIFLTSFLASALFWVSAGPARAHTGDPCPHTKNPDHKHCGGGGGGSIRVTVTFRDAGSSPPPPDRLRSDDLGDYVDKEDKVSTAIGTPGHFFMELTKGAQPVNRTLFLDFSDCVLGPCFPPFPEGSSGPANVETAGRNLREMAVNDTRFDLSLRVAFSVGGGIWHLFFGPHNVVVNSDCPGSSKIDVTRTGADTWVIGAGQNAVACLLEEIAPSDLILSGQYFMPFQITVQKK